MSRLVSVAGGGMVSALPVKVIVDLSGGALLVVAASVEGVQVIRESSVKQTIKPGVKWHGRLLGVALPALSVLLAASAAHVVVALRKVLARVGARAHARGRYVILASLGIVVPGTPLLAAHGGHALVAAHHVSVACCARLVITVSNALARLDAHSKWAVRSTH